MMHPITEECLVNTRYKEFLKVAEQLRLMHILADMGRVRQRTEFGHHLDAQISRGAVSSCRCLLPQGGGVSQPLSTARFTGCPDFDIWAMWAPPLTQKRYFSMLGLIVDWGAQEPLKLGIFLDESARALMRRLRRRSSVTTHPTCAGRAVRQRGRRLRRRGAW
jgi:hypothetical protein